MATEIIANVTKLNMGNGSDAPDFNVSTYKAALLTGTTGVADATIAAWANYAAASGYETSGTGYSAGGVTLANVSYAASGGDATIMVLDCDDPSWTTATVTFDAMFVYDSTAANAHIATYRITEKTYTAESFSIIISANGLLRVRTGAA